MNWTNTRKRFSLDQTEMVINGDNHQLHKMTDAVIHGCQTM